MDMYLVLQGSCSVCCAIRVAALFHQRDLGKSDAMAVLIELARPPRHAVQYSVLCFIQSLAASLAHFEVNVVPQINLFRFGHSVCLRFAPKGEVFSSLCRGRLAIRKMVTNQNGQDEFPEGLYTDFLLLSLLHRPVWPSLDKRQLEIRRIDSRMISL